MLCHVRAQNLKNRKDLETKYFQERIKKALIFKGFFYALHATMILDLYNLFLKSTGVSTDTRTIEKGQLFIALSGDNFDGNTYINAALEKGAMHALSDSNDFRSNAQVTVVENTVAALQELATYHRQQLNIPVVGLTGSNGKTTTKELILSVLSQSFNVKGTKGNLNNHIGVPLTVLSLDKFTEIGVVEMGANHQQEIAALAKIAKPTYGLITNFGKAHLEGFGSLEGVKKGKSELYDFLEASNGTAIVGTWDKEQLARTHHIARIETPRDTSVLDNTELLSFIINGNTVNTQLTGIYNYHNALLAYSVGTIFNMDTDIIIKGISDYTPTNHRSQLIHVGKLQIIMDSYNANPSSMEAAITNLAGKNTPFKIAVLGDMFELGIYAQEEHQKIADFAQKYALDEIHLIGSNFNRTVTTNAIKHENFEAFAASFKHPKETKTTVLIKGSRGMALERVLKLL